MGIENRLVTEASFINGVYYHVGSVASVDTATLNGEETNLAPLPEGAMQLAVVQTAPIGPTGPNPVMPQQIAPDARQTATGGYAQPGAIVTAEITQPLEQREQLIETPLANDTAQADLTKQLAETHNEIARLRAAQSSQQASGQLSADTSGSSGGEEKPKPGDPLIQGTVQEIKTKLDGYTDEQLTQMIEAENDREVKRTSLLEAIAAEQKKRQGDSLMN